MEEELTFGSVSAAVKVGNTVHRQTGVWTPTIHALLAFLRANHFGYSQKVLGIDEKGREILEFLPGEAASRPWPPQLLQDDGLIQAATLLKSYHGVVKDFVPPKNAEWRIGRVTLRSGQIVRHGDLGSWNTLWQNGKLTGLIDWDFAEPGEMITDLAQLAYYFVPLRGESGWRKAGFSVRPDISHRLRVLCTTYGMFAVDEVLVEVGRLLEEELERLKDKGEKNIEPWASFLKRGDYEELSDDLTWIHELQQN